MADEFTAGPMKTLQRAVDCGLTDPEFMERLQELGASIVHYKDILDRFGESAPETDDAWTRMVVAEDCMMYAIPNYWPRMSIPWLDVIQYADKPILGRK